MRATKTVFAVSCLRNWGCTQLSEGVSNQAAINMQRLKLLCIRLFARLNQANLNCENTLRSAGFLQKNFMNWIGRQPTSPWFKRIADSVWGSDVA